MIAPAEESSPAGTRSGLSRTALPALGLAALIGGSLLAGLWLRLYHLDLQAAMGDDAFTLVIGQQSLPGILRLSSHEPHPPLFYVLVHVWQIAAGTSELAGRYLGVWFGVAGLAALHRLGREIGGRWLGLLALVLAVPNPFLIGFSQQVRMYTLVVLMSTISCYMLLRLAASPTPTRAVGYFTTALATVYTHFFGFFVLLAQAAFVLAAIALFGRRKLLRPWLGSMAGVFLAYLPWVLFARETLLTYTNGLVRSASLPEILRRLPSSFLAGEPDTALPAWLLVLTGLLLLAGLALSLLRWPPGKQPWANAGKTILRIDRVVLVACYLLVPVIAVYLISLVRPMFFERYMVVILPAFVLALALGLAAISRPAWPVAIPLLAALLLPAWQFLPGYYAHVAYASGSDVRNMLSFIHESARPGAAVIVNLPPSDPMYRYYVPAEPEFFIPNPPADQQASTEQQLRNVLAQHAEIWLTPWDYDHTAFVERWLDEHAFRVDQHWFANAEIIRYESPRPPVAGTPSAATFAAPDATIELRAYQLYSAAAVRSGSPILFTLQWQSSGPTRERYKVFVHLLNSQNRVVTQRDDEPVANKRPTTSWKAGELIDDNYALVVPADAPAGPYQIEVGLYRPSDGVRLRLSNGDDRIILATIQVAG